MTYREDFTLPAELLEQVQEQGLDAYYEQVPEDGQVRHLAVLVAVAVTPTGKREILGVSVSLSEHEIHWRTFLESLKKRGLGGVQLITSDDHAGLRAAWLAVFGGIPWQRCQFHLQQNAQAYVPHKDMQSEVADDIRTIFNALSHHRRCLSGQSCLEVREECLPFVGLDDN